MLQNQVFTTYPLKALNIEKNTRLLNQHKEKTSIFKNWVIIVLNSDMHCTTAKFLSIINLKFNYQ